MITFVVNCKLIFNPDLPIAASQQGCLLRSVPGLLFVHPKIVSNITFAEAPDPNLTAGKREMTTAQTFTTELSNNQNNRPKSWLCISLKLSQLQMQMKEVKSSKYICVLTCTEKALFPQNLTFTAVGVTLEYTKLVRETTSLYIHMFRQAIFLIRRICIVQNTQLDMNFTSNFCFQICQDSAYGLHWFLFFIP